MPTAPGRRPCAAGTGSSECSLARPTIAVRAGRRRLPAPPAASSSVEVWRISRCSGVAAASSRALMSASASARSCPSGTLQQRGELEQLQVAHDPVGDVEVGVQAQLPQPAADPRDAGEHLAQRSIARASARSRAAAGGPPRAARASAERLERSRCLRRPRRRGGGPARACVGAGVAAHELGGQLLQPLEARALLGGVARVPSSGRPRTPRRSIRRPRNVVRLERCRARARRCGAARRSARCARAPPAGPAATRSPPPAPTTRSSLRRRATWITRARSTWRSSIGGRASARTTAAASCGSTSRRIQASTSRTSARRRNVRRPAAVLARGAPAARARSSSRAQPKDTAPGARPQAREPRGYALRVGLECDRLARGPAGRRAGRRLAAVRRRARRAVEPLAHDFAARVSAYSGLRPPARAAAAGGRRPPRVDRGQPADDAPAARAALTERRDRDAQRPARRPAALGLGPAAGRPGRGADGHALPARARPVRPRPARRLGAAAPAAAGPEPRPGGAQPRRRPRRAGAVGDDPRDHPRRPVLRRAVAARAPRRDAQRADRRPAGDARGRARRSSGPRAAGCRRLPDTAELRELVGARARGRAAAPDARRGPLAAGRADAGARCR